MGLQDTYMGLKIGAFFLFLFSICSGGFTQGNTSIQEGEWGFTGNIKLTGIDATAYPEVKTHFFITPDHVASMISLSPDQMIFREGELAVEIREFKKVADNQPILIALVVDKSEYAAGKPFGPSNGTALEASHAALRTLLQSVSELKDSVILVGFSGEVDILTDANQEVEIFEMILASMEAGGGSAFYDAISAAAEALAVHEGPKYIIAISHGQDTHSTITTDALIDQLLAQSVGLHVISTRATEHKPLAYKIEEIGGSFKYIETEDRISTYLNSLLMSLHEHYQVSFLAQEPLTPDMDRSFKLDIWQGSEVVAKTGAGYEVGKVGILPMPDSPVGRPDILLWAGALFLVLICIGGIYAIANWWKERSIPAPVIPVILELSYDTRRDQLKIRYNVPNRAKQAKFTIYSESGAPIKDAVLSGRKTRAFINITEMPEGNYVCDISNSGVVSETRKMIWHNP